MNIIIDLFKAAGHKYLKRIPYMNSRGKRSYRYIYKLHHTHHGKHVLHEDNVQVGTKLMMHSTDGEEHHVEVLSVHPDGTIDYRYDDGPKKGEVVEKVKSSTLLQDFSDHHGAEKTINTEAEKIKALIEEGENRGLSEKMLNRLRGRLERLTLTPKNKKKKAAPKKTTPKKTPPKKTPPKKATPKKTPPKKATPKKGKPKTKEILEVLDKKGYGDANTLPSWGENMTHVDHRAEGKMGKGSMMSAHEGLMLLKEQPDLASVVLKSPRKKVYKGFFMKGDHALKQEIEITLPTPEDTPTSTTHAFPVVDKKIDKEHLAVGYVRVRRETSPNSGDFEPWGYKTLSVVDLNQHAGRRAVLAHLRSYKKDGRGLINAQIALDKFHAFYDPATTPPLGADLSSMIISEDKHPVVAFINSEKDRFKEDSYTYQEQDILSAQSLTQSYRREAALKAWGDATPKPVITGGNPPREPSVELHVPADLDLAAILNDENIRGQTEGDERSVQFDFDHARGRVTLGVVEGGRSRGGRDSEPIVSLPYIPREDAPVDGQYAGSDEHPKAKSHTVRVKDLLTAVKGGGRIFLPLLRDRTKVQTIEVDNLEAKGRYTLGRTPAGKLGMNYNNTVLRRENP